jgi:hypothetical protein
MRDHESPGCTVYQYPQDCTLDASAGAACATGPTNKTNSRASDKPINHRVRIAKPPLFVYEP